MSVQAGFSTPRYGFRGLGAAARRSSYLAAVSNGYLERYDDLTRFFEEALARRGDAAL